MSTAKNPQTFADRRARDDWMRAILGADDLSLTTRLVGIYLGLAVDFNNWPSIRMAETGLDYAAIAAHIGLPRQIVADAVTTLERGRWLMPWWGRYRFRHYDINLPADRNAGGRS
jgi:hypothetical protein